MQRHRLSALFQLVLQRLDLLPCHIELDDQGALPLTPLVQPFLLPIRLLHQLLDLEGHFRVLLLLILERHLDHLLLRLQHLYLALLFKNFGGVVDLQRTQLNQRLPCFIQLILLVRAKILQLV